MRFTAQSIQQLKVRKNKKTYTQTRLKALPSSCRGRQNALLLLEKTNILEYSLFIES